jgi:tetratricopeptide (TPR) repeat protein
MGFLFAHDGRRYSRLGPGLTNNRAPLEKPMTTPEKMKAVALNFHRAVRAGVSIPKHAMWDCVSRFGVVSKALAVLLILHFAFWVTPGLAAKAKDASETDSLNEQIVVLYQTGKYQEAIPIAQQLLDIRKKINGPEHPATANSLNNLAALYEAMSEYAKAEPLLRRALAIWEKALGAEHPTTAKGLNNLAELYREMGEYTKAEPLYQRALAINEKALGPNCSATATSLNNLAVLYHDMGEHAKAEPL